MPRTLECTSSRHSLGQCEIVTVLRRRLAKAEAALAEQRAFSLRACERIYLAHEVLGNLAEGKEMKPQVLPDIRQTRDWDCATAAWKCVVKYHYGRNREVMDLSHPIRGTDPATLEAAIRATGWAVRAGDATVKDLQHYADHWKPTICLMTFPGAADSHYCVVAGVWRGRVFYQDPESGPQSMLADEFEASWKAIGQYSQFKHWALTCWPDG